MRRLREKTTSGPTAVTPAMVKTEALDDTLLLVDYQLANFSWILGEPAPTWLCGLDLLIYKTAGDFRAEKLRPILLFDIEANLHNNLCVLHVLTLLCTCTGLRMCVSFGHFLSLGVLPRWSPPKLAQPRSARSSDFKGARPVRILLK